MDRRHSPGTQQQIDGLIVMTVTLILVVMSVAVIINVVVSVAVIINVVMSVAALAVRAVKQSSFGWSHDRVCRTTRCHKPQNQ